MKSLGCLLRTDAVEALLKEARDSGTRYPPRAMGAGQAHAIISAVLWLHGTDAGSFSSAYAWRSLEFAIHGADLFEMRDMRRALGLNPYHHSTPSASESHALRVSLGLAHYPWRQDDA